MDIEIYIVFPKMNGGEIVIKTLMNEFTSVLNMLYIMVCLKNIDEKTQLFIKNMKENNIKNEKLIIPPYSNYDKWSELYSNLLIFYTIICLFVSKKDWKILYSIPDDLTDTQKIMFNEAKLLKLIKIPKMFE